MTQPSTTPPHADATFVPIPPDRASGATLSGGFGWRRAVDLFFKGVEALMAFLLVGMIGMVLGNVILRYGFDTGIMASEELSRTFFVWLIFIGAVVAARERRHLSADSMLHYLPRPAAIGLAVLREVLIISCCAMLFAGSVAQHDVNATTSSLVTGMSLIWEFGVIYVMSAGIIAFSLRSLWRIVSGQASDPEIFGSSGGDETGAPAGEAL